MTLERTAIICFCIVLTSSIATGQPKSTATAQAQRGPARSVVEPTYEAGDVMPLRRVETRSKSNGREVVVETVEELDIEGRMAPALEIVTETTSTKPNAADTRQDVFTFTADHRRKLVETTESRRDTQPNGNTSAVRNTWASDINGRLRLTSRQTEHTTSSASDVRRTETTLLLPHDQTLQEAERVEHAARRINPQVVRYDSTHLVRDVNGRWQPVETRRGEVREIGASEHLEEETIQRPDMNGKLAVSETNVIRRSTAKNEEDVVIETHAPYTDGVPGADGQLPLSQRVHRTTTATADGGSYTVEEVEARNPVAPTEPMRVVSRTVTTVRSIGTDEWVTERQVFERDVNGQLRHVRND